MRRCCGRTLPGLVTMNVSKLAVSGNAPVGTGFLSQPET
jgi:hypothetical protein